MLYYKAETRSGRHFHFPAVHYRLRIFLCFHNKLAVVADVIDYQEYKTGIKNESAVYAVYTFCRKLGQTAADYGGLMLLGKVGYDVQLMSNAGYVDGVSEGILKICTLIPAITYTLIFLLYQFAYPLSKSKLEPVYDYVRNMNCAAQSRETY